MRLLALATALSAIMTPVLADDIPGTEFTTGYWDGAAQTDDRGAFSHCAVSVGYTNGETLWMGLYPDNAISILLTHPDVTFKPGEQFQVWIMTETGPAWSGTGEAWDSTYAGITFDGIDETVAFLSSGQYFRMIGIGIDDAYDVTGIADALGLAQNCLAQNSGSNPFGTTKPGKTPPPPKVPDLKPKTGAALGTKPGGALGTPAPKPQP